VAGIDASGQMVGRARRKAARAGVEVELRAAAIEALPYPDASVDVVLSTLMLHHLPRALKEAGMREVRRVLRPGGRALIVDFGSTRKPGGILGRLHRYGRVKFEDLTGLLGELGFRVVEQGDVGVKDLQFVLAAK
jgi:ubiquinone/menaquinone biosynthesis C-methylase UbiE